MVNCSDLVVMEHCGQYTILGNIGEGAHGIVFKAKHIEVCFIVTDFNFPVICESICLFYFIT